MAFRGWPVEAVEFYEGLEADNSKTYWQKNKGVYERAVRVPMEELLAELAGEFGDGRIFRPHRDVRFSADKSPYKTNCSATVGDGYVALSAHELKVASGLYMPEPAELQRYRDALDAERSGAELAEIVAALHAAGYQITAHDTLKSAPRGYPRDHPRIELLRHKGIAMTKGWPIGAWLGTRKAKDRVVKALRAAAPLNEWLGRNVR
ncbi:DUF2461 domain-containing protein [Mycobacterium parmense]|uniref:TIGR02453 family protein n=1 Tax=Mycobacterium parmense TaxID=185642 RepID=A0A7I7YUI8_9MYCO|nr:DUF2461 domain-containing protein [Mycobacterium parmense]MCV7351027.1 DUF2461 domain-containing protein [Mycobacterium parmense]ORW60601.1 hypothetical protein AWC20_06380 [Mycobacterium parmense]BBZ45535.1 TIGR02453 family protein [Mycobacterium parmense]